jgi:hypothetical protein
VEFAAPITTITRSTFSPKIISILSKNHHIKSSFKNFAITFKPISKKEKQKKLK